MSRNIWSVMYDETLHNMHVKWNRQHIRIKYLGVVLTLGPPLDSMKWIDIKYRILTLIKPFARYINIGFWSDSSLSLSLRIKSSSKLLLGLGVEKAPWKRTAQIAATNSICLFVRYIITNRFRRNPITI